MVLEGQDLSEASNEPDILVRGFEIVLSDF